MQWYTYISTCTHAHTHTYIHLKSLNASEIPDSLWNSQRFANSVLKKLININIINMSNFISSSDPTLHQHQYLSGLSCYILWWWSLNHSIHIKKINRYIFFKCYQFKLLLNLSLTLSPCAKWSQISITPANSIINVVSKSLQVYTQIGYLKKIVRLFTASNINPLDPVASW